MAGCEVLVKEVGVVRLFRYGLGETSLAWLVNEARGELSPGSRAKAGDPGWNRNYDGQRSPSHFNLQVEPPPEFDLRRHESLRNNKVEVGAQSHVTPHRYVSSFCRASAPA